MKHGNTIQSLIRAIDTLHPAELRQS